MDIAKKTISYGFLIALLAVNGFAADTASHQVTVSVGAISQVGVTGGDVALTIDAYDGENIVSTANADAGLIWETNQEHKITVATDLEAPAYALTVEAASISGTSDASSTGRVTVDTQARDLVDNIDRGAGACTLVYTAAADLTAGNTIETHTITYTITGN